MANTYDSNAWKIARERFLQVHHLARLIGPSGDGCHIEVDGKWFAYGNIPENAWIGADRKLVTGE